MKETGAVEGTEEVGSEGVGEIKANQSLIGPVTVQGLCYTKYSWCI